MAREKGSDQHQNRPSRPALVVALREAIGGQTLDELLGAKGELDREIHASACSKIEKHGIRLASVGVKDVILPGEMKDILNRVVEAEGESPRARPKGRAFFCDGPVARIVDRNRHVYSCRLS